MFTKEDVGPKNINGKSVDLSDAEKQAIADEWNANLSTVIVPSKVTMRQARLALLAAGKLQAVNTAINAMNGAEGAAAQIEWEFSSEVHRNRPLVLSLAPVLGMTNAELDQLFIAASQL